MDNLTGSGLKAFKEFFENNVENLKDTINAENDEMVQFIREYPLERLNTLTVDEYCLGTDTSKDSLCYMIEFGKYKETGFRIGGGSANKFGVYYSRNEKCFKHGPQTIDDIDVFWPLFRDEMYQFIVKSGNDGEPHALEEFSLLQGMAMVLTKFLSIYYPEKYICIGSSQVLKSLLDEFDYNYQPDMRCHQLNYKLSQCIRKDLPDITKYGDHAVGFMLWRYSMAKKEDIEKEVNKEAGLGDQDVVERHYWLYSPGRNASAWPKFSSEGLMGVGWEELGDLSMYETRGDMIDKMKELFGQEQSYIMDSLATWQFANEMKPGDIVYAKKGMLKIVGRGIVTSDYYYDDTQDSFNSLRKVDWKDIGEWDHPGKAAMKTLTDITAYTDYIEKLESLFEDPDSEELIEEEKTWPIYDKEKFLNEVYISEDSYETLVGLVKNKKNVILQGAPGVGKTFAANRLAYSMMGEKNKDRVMMVQFHQSYSYEDFIEGFRPLSDSNGFEIKKGSFYNFCKKAADDAEHEYFFIIDEINRGNISKIFGELFMLIEKDKRGNALQLLYSDEKFFVPKNVYIIGMMNTADRSLAMLDYALRRRFAFYEMKPAFDQDKFVEYKMNLDSTKFNNLIDCVKRLNDNIKNDGSLGEGFCIGHSYFCELKEVNDAVLSSIVEYELIPLLKEYWFDDQATVRDWAEKLRSAIK